MKEEYEGFIEYPKIRMLGYEENKTIFDDDKDRIVVEEKFDGANTRFFVKDGKVYVGSRKVILGTTTGEEKIGRYTRAAKTFVTAIKRKEEKYDRMIFFGETMVKHTLDYDWDKIPPIIMFDVYNVKTGKFLNLEEKTKIFKDLGLEQPPYKIFKSEELKQMSINDGFVPQSKYRNGQAEGVVFKNYNKQMFAKYVRNKFKEESKEAFGDSKKYAKNDDERIVSIYVTNARIEKIIYKLIDEGHQLSMPLMNMLPKRVWNDVIEEEGKKILMSSYKIDFRNVRRLMAKRCLAVLKQMIVNNALLQK